MVAILDRLIAISVDGEKRYQHAAKDVESSLEAFFEWQAYDRKTAADELAAERRLMFGDGKENETVGGFADRTAMDFSGVTSKGDTGAVEWRREDDAKGDRGIRASPFRNLPPICSSCSCVSSHVCGWQ